MFVKSINFQYKSEIKTVFFVSRITRIHRETYFLSIYDRDVRIVITVDRLFKTHLASIRHLAREVPPLRRRQGCGCWRRFSPLESSVDHRRLPWLFWASYWDPLSIFTRFSAMTANRRERNRHLTSSHRTYWNRVVFVAGVVVHIFVYVTSLTTQTNISRKYLWILRTFP